MNIRTDDLLKREAELLFADLGMNMTTAINIFLKQAVRENRIPFEITRNIPTALTIAAFKEGDAIANDKNVKGYKDIESLRKALGV